MLDQFNTHRSKNGYINLNDYSDKTIDLPTYGSRQTKQWFIIDGEKYLFKPNGTPLEDVKEIINEEFSKSLGIKCAEYDFATYKDRKGIVTRDFIKDQKFIPGVNLLCEINKVSNDICSYLAVYQNRHMSVEQISENIRIHLLNHLLDIFTCQNDRNVTNIAVFEKNSKLIPTPRFDSANSFLATSEERKCQLFVNAENKDERLARYRGTNTKFSILSNNMFDDNIDELLEAQYNPNLALPEIIRVELSKLENFIEKELFSLDFDSVYYLLKNYNVNLKQLYQDLFKTVFDYKREQYELRRVRIK